MRWLLSLGLMCGGCFGSSDIDLSGVEVALVAASSIGHSASMTGAAMNAPVACVTISQPCSAAFPCNGTGSVTLGTWDPASDEAGDQIVQTVRRAAELPRVERKKWKGRAGQANPGRTFRESARR